MKRTGGVVALWAAGVFVMAHTASATVSKPKEASSGQLAGEAAFIAANIVTTVWNVSRVSRSGSMLVGSLGVAIGLSTIVFAAQIDPKPSSFLDATGSIAAAAGALSLLRAVQVRGRNQGPRLQVAPHVRASPDGETWTGVRLNVRW